MARFQRVRLKSEKILHDKESVRANLLKNCASTKEQALVNGYLIRDLVLANDNATGD